MVKHKLLCSCAQSHIYVHKHTHQVLSLMQKLNRYTHTQQIRTFPLRALQILILRVPQIKLEGSARHCNTHWPGLHTLKHHQSPACKQSIMEEGGLRAVFMCANKLPLRASNTTHQTTQSPYSFFSFLLVVTTVLLLLN